MLSFLVLIAVALLVLSFLIVIHEFGHFIAAKLVGVWPEEFGIGLPPRVWGKKIGETIWSINALPFGGFVRLHGETYSADDNKPERSFMRKSKLARAFIAVAGVAMNFLFAIIGFAFIFFAAGIPQGVTVESVVPESPAASIGLTEKDTILAIDRRPLYNPGFFRQIIEKHAGKEMTLQYKDQETGEVVEKNFVLRQNPPEGQGLLGVTFNENAPAGFVEAQGLQKVFVSLQYGVYQTYDLSALILTEFGKMFSQAFAGKVPAGLTGPVGVVGVTAEAVRRGPLDVINLAALISLNLALLNLVPFPPLDGSRILFLIIEAIVGKKRLPKYEEKIYAIGMYLLIALIVFLTIREIPKALSAGSLEAFVQSLVQ